MLNLDLNLRKIAIGAGIALAVCLTVLLIAWTQRTVESAPPVKPDDQQEVRAMYKGTLDQIERTYLEKRGLINETYGPRLIQLFKQDRDAHGKLVNERNKALKTILNERNEAQRIAWDKFKEKQLEWLVID